MKLSTSRSIQKLKKKKKLIRGITKQTLVCMHEHTNTHRKWRGEKKEGTNKILKVPAMELESKQVYTPQGTITKQKDIFINMYVSC